MPTAAQLLCPDWTHTKPKFQDPLNNLAEAATCRFSAGEYPTKTCFLLHGKDAYHPTPTPVTQSECLYCTQTMVLPRSPYSTSPGRAQVKRVWRDWERVERKRFS